MRSITIVLLLLLIALQYPLWLGKGGWLKIWDLNHQLDAHQQANAKIQARNAALDAEVRDLKQGTDAIDERARSELGMIKQGEQYFQLLDASTAALVAPASAIPAVHTAR